MNAGSTWSRPWPGEPCRWRQRWSAGSRSREGGEQVVVAAGAGLDQRHPGGRVRDEHVEQTVASGRRLVQELRALGRQVVHGLAASGAHRQQRRQEGRHAHMIPQTGCAAGPPRGRRRLPRLRLRQDAPESGGAAARLPLARIAE